MTSKIRWKPQPSSSLGDFVPSAFLNILDPGSAHDGLLEPELLVRETAQNSWDARLAANESPVGMSYDLVAMRKGDPRHDAYTDFFADCSKSGVGMSPNSCGLGDLVAALGAKELRVLRVRDVGTWGLGGPTDASLAVTDVGSDRYVKFMLNIGDANTDTAAGGAFGIGRSVFWRMSECRTVVVYTRCKVGRSVESRLVGLSFSKTYDHGRRKYTGRHWWTAADIGRPTTGSDADEWARRLGIEPYGRGETGTTAIVIAPTSPGGVDDLASAIAGSVELHLWPKYVTVEGRRQKDTMSFDVTVDGRPVRVRDRAELAGSVLGAYVECFARLVSLEKSKSTATDSESIVKSTILSHDYKKKTHPKYLGRLVTRITAAATAPTMADGDEDEDPPFAPLVRARHASLGDSIALLRTPELVVCYESVDPADDPAVRVVGVFKSLPQANDYFRRSEDSSHASWSANRLPQGEQVVVRKFHDVLQRRIAEWYTTPPPPPKDGGSVLATERIADGLGQWFTDWSRGSGGSLPPEGKGGKGGTGGKGGGGGGRSLGTLRIDSLPLEEHDGAAVNVWRLHLEKSASGAIRIGLREADEDGSLMRSIEAGPGVLPTLVRIESTNEFRVDGSTRTTKRHDFNVGPSRTNVTDVLIRPVDTDPTTITVYGRFDEGTSPVLVAELIVDPSAGGSA